MRKAFNVIFGVGLVVAVSSSGVALPTLGGWPSGRAGVRLLDEARRWAQRGSTAANPHFGKATAACGTPVKGR